MVLLDVFLIQFTRYNEKNNFYCRERRLWVFGLCRRFWQTFNGYYGRCSAAIKIKENILDAVNLQLAYNGKTLVAQDDIVLKYQGA